MKRLTAALAVGMLVFSGVYAFAMPSEKTSIERIKVEFSESQIREENDYISIDFGETNTYLMSQGKPILPMYTRKFVYPFKTEIKPTPGANVAGKLVTKNTELLSKIYPDK